MTMFEKICDGFAEIERNQERVERIDITLSDWNKLRENKGVYRQFFDVETHREILETGMIGTLLGASVYLNKTIEHTILTSEYNKTCVIGKELEPKFNYNVKLKFINEHNIEEFRTDWDNYIFTYLKDRIKLKFIQEVL